MTYGSNQIGLFKIKHMTSRIPIRVLLVHDGILQYSFGFGLYTPQVGTQRVQKHQKDSLQAVEYSNHWLETAAVVTFR